MIVSLDHDLLGPGPHQVTHAGAWANGRGEVAPGQGRSRLHVAEAVPSLTGTVASTRLPCDTSRLARAGAGNRRAVFARRAGPAPDLSESEKRWLDRAMRELRAHRGPIAADNRTATGSAMAGARADRERATEQCRRNRLVQRTDTDSGKRCRNRSKHLATDMAAGSVDTLIVLDCNPAYTAPGALEICRASRACAEPHPCGPARRRNGHVVPLAAAAVASAGKPGATRAPSMAAPPSSSRSSRRFTPRAASISSPTCCSARSIPRPTPPCARPGASNSAARSTTAGHARCMTASLPARAARPLSVSANVPAAPDPATPSAQGVLDIVFRPDPTVWDGRFGNIAWLQELPKPLTKITWDNVIAVSPAIAAAQSLSNGDIVEVTVGARNVHGPAWIVPGQASDTVALFFGYGRRAGGDIAQWLRLRRLLRSARRAHLERSAARSRAPQANTRSPRRRRITAWTASTSCAKSRPQIRACRRRRRRTHSIRNGTRAATERRARLGHGDRSRSLHRLQRLRLRLQRREQRAGGRQGPGRARPRDAVAARRPLLHRRCRKPDAATSSRCPACIARRRPARWAARCMPPCIRRKASTRWSTTAASARAPARATAPTRCGASTGTTTAISPKPSRR